ncbi:MAG: serine/threonine-protein kinase [Planctomycetota bacterium]
MLQEQLGVAGQPDEIGPYRVLEVLGQGGVGTVFLVQQREPIRRKAALKLIKLGMDTREVLVRFAQERQMLATMSHPNIAKVFDAGQTETGRPYFVMEYVPGEPITDYCDHHRLNLSDRLRLFVTVCRAIQHAHQKGILHRDVKPSNVIVAEQDGLHVPMVIDFGLAKVLRTEPASANLLTRQGQFLGTPRYMSPEQIELPSEEVDTRSDVYSLGVVLFELIVGEPPYERHITDGGIAKLLSSIKHEDSTRPSTRLSALTRDGKEIAESRRTDRAALLNQVRGDLDWIVVKALERDRERRYASAAELAADIERYLNREPIAARPPTAAYRVERFVRRNPLAVIAMLAVALALVLGSGLSTFWYWRANETRDEKAVLIGICEDIRSNISTAHLWFEEAVAGDRTHDVEQEVIAPIELALGNVRALLEPSAGSEPPRLGETRDEFEALARELARMLDVTRQRWASPGGAGRIGGELDQEYDGIYVNIMRGCTSITTQMHASSNEDWRRAAQSASAVNALVLILLLAGGGVALRFLAKRA